MSGTVSPLTLQVDPAGLRELICMVVVEVVGQLEETRKAVPSKLCFSEEEAAGLLGLESHQLRDERRRGRITACRIVGRRIRYMREDLVRYLLDRKVGLEDRTRGPFRPTHR